MKSGPAPWNRTTQVPNGAPCPSRTDFDRIQADHIAVNAYGAKWSLAADLNRALLLTKQARRHLRLQGTLMERNPGVQPGWLVWKTSA